MRFFWFSTDILFNFLSKFVTQYIDWTTFEPLAEIERDYKERQLNSAWEIGLDIVERQYVLLG